MAAAAYQSLACESRGVGSTTVGGWRPARASRDLAGTRDRDAGVAVLKESRRLAVTEERTDCGVVPGHEPVHFGRLPRRQERSARSGSDESDLGGGREKSSDEWPEQQDVSERPRPDDENPPEWSAQGAAGSSSSSVATLPSRSAAPHDQHVVAPVCCGLAEIDRVGLGVRVLDAIVGLGDLPGASVDRVLEAPQQPVVADAGRAVASASSVNVTVGGLLSIANLTLSR